MTTIKYLLDEDQMPRAWYNIQADLPQPAPAVLHLRTMQNSIGPDDLAPLPMSLIEQEVSTEREIPIPEPVRRAAHVAPAPCTEQQPGRKARLPRFFTNTKGSAPAGSHKLNTAIPRFL